MKHIIVLVSTLVLFGGCNACGSDKPSTAERPAAPAVAATPVKAPAAGGLTAAGAVSVEGFNAAASDGKAVELTGILFEVGAGNFVLASSLCETAPPRPCGTTLALKGVDAKAADPLLTERMADKGIVTTRWSKATVVVKGSVAAGALTVSAVGPG